MPHIARLKGLHEWPGTVGLVGVARRNRRELFKQDPLHDLHDLNFTWSLDDLYMFPHVSSVSIRHFHDRVNCLIVSTHSFRVSTVSWDPGVTWQNLRLPPSKRSKLDISITYPYPYIYIIYTSHIISIQNNPCMKNQMLTFHYISAFMTLEFLEVLGPAFLCSSNVYRFDRTWQDVYTCK